MTIAHAAGVPLEELLTLAPVAGAFCIALRAQVHTIKGAKP